MRKMRSKDMEKGNIPEDALKVDKWHVGMKENGEMTSHWHPSWMLEDSPVPMLQGLVVRN